MGGSVRVIVDPDDTENRKSQTNIHINCHSGFIYNIQLGLCWTLWGLNWFKLSTGHRRAMVVRVDFPFNTFSVSTSATCWLCPHIWAVGASDQPLHSYFCYCWAAELHWQCRVTEESASCMQHSLLPAGGAVENLSLHRWSLISPGMKIYFYVHPHFCLGVSQVCVFTSSPVDVCLWFPYLCSCFYSRPVNRKLNGLDPLLSSSYITPF